MRGSDHNDPFAPLSPPAVAATAAAAGPCEAAPAAPAADFPPVLRTTTNLSGGIQGGISNGMYINMSVAFKPPATIGLPQQTGSYSHARLLFTCPLTPHSLHSSLCHLKHNCLSLKNSLSPPLFSRTSSSDPLRRARLSGSARSPRPLRGPARRGRGGGHGGVGAGRRCDDPDGAERCCCRGWVRGAGV